MAFCLINGQLVASETASVPIADRGFRYGDGVFETLAVRGGVPYQFDWHVQRMAAGLLALKIKFDSSILYSNAHLLLQKNALSEGILRMQVTRGAGSRGYLPDAAHGSGPTLVMETLPQPAIGEKPVALWRSNYAKISTKALPIQYKLCQGVNSTLARMEADEHDCADALMLNAADQIGETSSGNIFWLKDEKLYTPALACGILEGATRAAVMRLSPYPVQEVETGIEALTGAEAVFITNSVWPVLAVGCLLPEKLRWDSAAIARDFRRLIDDDRVAFASAHRGQWQAEPRL